MDMQKRIELHMYSDHSQCENLGSVDEIVKQAKAKGFHAVAITDLANVHAYPEAFRYSMLHGIKLIPGLECYLKCDKDHFRAILLARKESGLHNLYRIITESHMQLFDGLPLVTKGLIEHYREEILVGSVFEQGELYQMILEKKSGEEISGAAEFYDFIELQPPYPFSRNKTTSESKVWERIYIIKKLIELGENQRKLVIAAGSGASLLTDEEMLNEFGFMDNETAKNVVLYNSSVIDCLTANINPVCNGTLIFKVDGDDDKLGQMVFGRAMDIYGRSFDQFIKNQLYEELGNIFENGYSSMYLLIKDVVRWIREDGYTLSSCGSMGSSLLAYVLGITGINPLPPHYVCPKCFHMEIAEDKAIGCGADLPDKYCPLCNEKLRKDGFNLSVYTFIGSEGNKVPDFNLYMSTYYRKKTLKRLKDRYGENHIVAMGEVKRDSATGITMVEEHPHRILITPANSDIYSCSPKQYSKNDMVMKNETSYFGYDFLGGNLDSFSLIEREAMEQLRCLYIGTGIDPQYIKLEDKEVLKLFHSQEPLRLKEQIHFQTGAAGIADFDLEQITRMLLFFKPQNFDELIRVAALDTPYNTWSGNAEELIKSGTAGLKEVISTREDVIFRLAEAGIPGKEIDRIIRNMWRGKDMTGVHEALLTKCNIPQWYIESMKKIRYFFPRSHIAAEVLLAYRLAWYKLYNPDVFYKVMLNQKLYDEKINQVVAKGRDSVRSMLDTSPSMTRKELQLYRLTDEMYARGYRFAERQNI